MFNQLLNEALKNCDQAEIFWVANEETPVSFEANRLKSVDTRQSSGAGMRIIKQGKIGASSTTNRSNLDELVSRALEIVPYGPDSPILLPGPRDYLDTKIHDVGTVRLTTEEIIHVGSSLIAELKDLWPDVQWDARLSRSVSEVKLTNSQGFQGEYQKTVFGLGIEGTLVRDTDMLFVWESQTGCGPRIDTDEIRDNLNNRIRWADRVASPPKGDVPVIFTPKGVAGLLIGPLLSGFNGRNIAQGSSPLIGQIHSKLFDHRLTITDDPTCAFIPGSRPFDDEGVLARPTLLIDRGTVGNFLFDLQTALQAGCDSTGSAHRSISGSPGPGTSVVIIDPGDSSFEEIVSKQENALIVESFLGAGQGNILAGDFSANVLLGYRVANGEIVGRVKNTMISGNVYRILADLVSLGSDSRWVGGGLRTPSIVVSGVSIASNG